jgi:hypothetical protein
MKNHLKEFQSKSKEDLPIFIKWMDFVKWLLVTTDNFPKKARFTFTERIVSFSLSVIEDLIEARYSGNKYPVLKRINVNLEKIRVMTRICFELRFLPKKSYEHASYRINEVGRMLGGWLKQQRSHEKIQ